MSFAPGDVIDGRYHLRQKLGAGGYGEVWLAEQPELDRLVAIKFVRATFDRESRVRFQRETGALARVEHEHVLQLFHSGQTDGSTPFIVTEYVQGRPLREWGNGRALTEIITVVRQIASALHAAHREGLIHRDLKPHNILVSVAPGGGPFVKVLDFGLARMVGREPQDVTVTGQVIGTPGHMSPEQLRGRREIGAATDLYCLGIILWELLEERRIFTAETAIGISMRHLKEPPPPLTRDVPGELAELTMKLLSKEPAARPAASGVIRVLDRLLGVDRAPAGPADAQRPPLADPPRRGMLIVIGVAAGLALLGFGVSILDVSDDAPPPMPKTLPGGVLTVREASDPSIATPKVVDAGTDGRAVGAAVGAQPTPGCGRRDGWRVGARQPISNGYGDLAYVPTSYDPNAPSPLVVLLHEGGQFPSEMLDQAGMEELANANRFVVFAPSGTELSVFKGGGMAAFPWSNENVSTLPGRVADVMTRLCIDAGKMFVVGQGRGGAAALSLVSLSDRFAAVVTTAHRRKTDDRYPAPKVRVPYLFLAPTASPKYPDDGQPDDCNSYEYVAIGEQDRVVREYYGCRGEARPSPTADGATCRTWDCEVPYVSCRVEGGIWWPGHESEQKAGCAKEPPSPFDYRGEIWRFFDEVTRDCKHAP